VNGITENPQPSPIDLLTKIFSAPSQGSLPVKVVLRASNGVCYDDSVYSFSVMRQQSLFIPTVFSPSATNPDNQTFRVFGNEVAGTDFTFVVMNRWGEVVYTAANFSDAKQGWNGKKNNGGEECPVGSYSYAVKGKYTDGTPFEKSGIVNLVR
jgi:hypothetical protein